MKEFHSGDVPFEPADERNFVGSARVKKLPLVDGSEPVVVYLVQFDPGGRTTGTATAASAAPVKDGQGYVQKWGEPAHAIGPGDAITIEPNEKHWHGAAAGAQLTHLAVNLNFTTEWLEPVSDDQYRAS